MLQRQRDKFARLVEVTNIFGASLDMTATSPQKVKDRLKAHHKIGRCIMLICLDDPENPQREEDVEESEELLNELEELANTHYPDIYGNK